MTNTSTFVYVSHQAGREIRVLRLDSANGDLTPVQKVPVNGAAMPMAVSPDRRHLYVALRTEPYAVASFAIDQSSGELTHLADTPIPDSLPYISTDRSGRYLLCVSNPASRVKPRNGLLCVCPIDARGIVQLPQQTVLAPEKAHAVLPAPSNRHLFHTSCDGGMILCWGFDPATGKLAGDAATEVRVKAGAGPRHFVFHPNGRFLYLVNEYDGTLYTYALDAATGALEQIQISEIIARDPAGKATRAADLHFTPDGRLLFASQRLSSTLAAFRVDPASGLLTHLGNMATEKEPRGFNIDPLGRYLLAAGRLSDSMTVYAIDGASGKLTELRKYPMGDGPNWIEIVALTK